MSHAKRKEKCPDCGGPVEKGGFCEAHYLADWRRRKREGGPIQVQEDLGPNPVEVKFLVSANLAKRLDKAGGANRSALLRRATEAELQRLSEG